MSWHLKEGQTLFIPFVKGKTVSDSQGKPRMYKSISAFKNYFKDKEPVVLMEYKPRRVSEWVGLKEPGMVTCGGNPYYVCSNCGEPYGSHDIYPRYRYCPGCGDYMKSHLTFSESDEQNESGDECEE